MGRSFLVLADVEVRGKEARHELADLARHR